CSKTILPAGALHLPPELPLFTAKDSGTKRTLAIKVKGAGAVGNDPVLPDDIARTVLHHGDRVDLAEKMLTFETLGIVSQQNALAENLGGVIPEMPGVLRVEPQRGIGSLRHAEEIIVVLRRLGKVHDGPGGRLAGDIKVIRIKNGLR